MAEMWKSIKEGEAISEQWRMHYDWDDVLCDQDRDDPDDAIASLSQEEIWQVVQTV